MYGQPLQLLYNKLQSIRNLTKKPCFTLHQVAPEQMTMDERPPHDFMHRAICVTICCFWPTGIVAILKASEARNAYARGDIEAAKRSTHEAHQMSNISILIGLASFLLVLIIVGILIGTGN
uniref:Proline-rich transmembrane protein 1 n=1 Tax=Magallana gigas TaxID=29159 RepID=K1RGZ6_MAGGI